jgi:hypothetical protein
LQALPLGSAQRPLMHVDGGSQSTPVATALPHASPSPASGAQVPELGSLTGSEEIQSPAKHAATDVFPTTPHASPACAVEILAHTVPLQKSDLRISQLPDSVHAAPPVVRVAAHVPPPLQ